MMIRVLWAAAVTSLIFGCSRPSPNHADSIAAPKPGPGVFFVATNGNDLWSGRLPAPNGPGTDGPFASLPAALTAARASRQQAGNGARDRKSVV